MKRDRVNLSKVGGWESEQVGSRIQSGVSPIPRQPPQSKTLARWQNSLVPVCAVVGSWNAAPETGARRIVILTKQSHLLVDFTLLMQKNKPILSHLKAISE